MSSLKKNIAYNTGYQLLLILIPFITSPYLARVLGADGVGIYSYTYSVANYFVLFSMLGLSNYGNKSISAVSDSEQARSQKFFEIYCMQVIWAFFVLCAYILYSILLVKEYRKIVFIQAIYVASSMFDINWFFFGMEEFKKTVLRNFIIKVSTLACIFIFVRSSGDIWKYALIMSVGILFSQLWMWGYLRRYVRFTKIDYNGVVQHIKPNLILFIPVISYSIYKIMDKIMLGNMATMTSVGIYEYAEKIVNIPFGFISAFGTVMLPRISNLAAKKEESLIKAYINDSFEYISLIACAMAFGLIVIADRFVPLYYGTEFFDSSYILMLLAITILFVSWANILRTQYLIPFGKDKVYLLSTIVGAGVNLVVNAMLIPSLREYGAAIGTILAEFSVVAVQAIGTRKVFNYIQLTRRVIPSILSGIIMVIVSRSIAWKFLGGGIVSLVLLIGIGGVTYVLSVLFFYIFVMKNTKIVKQVYKIIRGQ